MNKEIKKSKKNNIISAKEVKKIDTKLLFKIILCIATVAVIDLDYLKRLINSKLLHQDEENLVKKYLQITEELNTQRVSRATLALKDDYFADIFKDFNFKNNALTIRQGDEEFTFPQELLNDFAQLVDLFIVERKKEQLETQAFEELRQNGITSTLKRIIDNVPQVPINVSNQDILDIRQLYNATKSRFSISTTLSYIDNIINGLEQGYVNTLVTNEIGLSKIFSINVIYKALHEGYNVLCINNYIEIEEIVESLAMKHFQAMYPEKSKDLKISDIKYHKVPENSTFWTSYDDFINNYRNQLIVLTPEQVDITSIERLQSVLYSAQTSFVNNTDHGIDLLVIEGIENLSLEKGYHKIANVPTILSNYLPFFKVQAKHFLNTNCPIAVLITTCNTNMKDARRSDLYGELKAYVSVNNMDKSIYQHSDNIICLQNIYTYHYFEEAYIIDLYMSKCKNKITPSSSIELGVNFENYTIKENIY